MFASGIWQEAHHQSVGVLVGFAHRFHRRRSPRTVVACAAVFSRWSAWATWRLCVSKNCDLGEMCKPRLTKPAQVSQRLGALHLALQRVCVVRGMHPARCSRRSSSAAVFRRSLLQRSTTTTHNRLEKRKNPGITTRTVIPRLVSTTLPP